MKITEIESIALRVPYEERIRKQFYHFGLDEQVTVYKVHTDNGLIGLGENPGPPFDQDLLDAYIGTNPFDHVMGEGRFNLDMACYDLMGKHLRSACMEADGSAGSPMGINGLVDALHVARR